MMGHRLADKPSNLQAHGFVAMQGASEAESWSLRIRPKANGLNVSNGHGVECIGAYGCYVNSCHIYDAAVDADNDLVVVGRCEMVGGVPSEGEIFDGSNSVDIGAGGFVLKFDSAGKLLWKNNYPTAFPTSVAIDECRNVFVGGSINAPTTFGSEVHTPYSEGSPPPYSKDGFVIQLAP